MKERSLVRTLVELGSVDEAAILNFLLREHGFEMIDVLTRHPSDDVLLLIPRAFAMRHYVMPIEWDAGVLIVAMEDPTDQRLIETIESEVYASIKPMLARGADIEQALARYPTVEQEREVYIASQSFAYRALRSLLFPLLFPAPIGLLLCLMAQTHWRELQHNLIKWVASGFDFGLQFFIVWGIWSVGLWYLNGLIFPDEPPPRQPPRRPPPPPDLS